MDSDFEDSDDETPVPTMQVDFSENGLKHKTRQTGKKVVEKPQLGAAGSTLPEVPLLPPVVPARTLRTLACRRPPVGWPHPIRLC